MAFIKLGFKEGTWKDTIGGGFAGVCSILGVLAAIGHAPSVFAFFLIPATVLIPRFVVKIERIPK